jgi:hypothetical protein
MRWDRIALFVVALALNALLFRAAYNLLAWLLS